MICCLLPLPLIVLQQFDLAKHLPEGWGADPSASSSAIAVAVIVGFRSRSFRKRIERAWRCFWPRHLVLPVDRTHFPRRCSFPAWWLWLWPAIAWPSTSIGSSPPREGSFWSGCANSTGAGDSIRSPTGSTVWNSIG